ncbi:uncharacterized protein LOC130826147 [Amaranthus tricolor]|uniref:uncharacterized protein LOC130826147 n=1 Tax=Amaranthus tricolor TaxID=29722 RepID=UPI00259055D6|nr:uncharacterized protein LOC130826147 [Amaranthus tricolor]
MANATHQNPDFHISKAPHKLNTNKQIVPKNKLSKKLSPKLKTKMRNPSFSNKALKVVHISSPMKYKATVAEFRALVQGLTGRDAVIDWPDEPAHGSDQNQCKTDGNIISVDDGGNYGVCEQVDNQDPHHDFEEGACFGSSDLSYDYFGNFHSDVDDHDYDMELESLRAFMVDDDH